MNDRTNDKEDTMEAATQPGASQEREVPLDEGMSGDFDQGGPAPEAPAAPAKPKDEDVVDVLRPKAEPKTWTIGKDDYERTYVQRPLSFIQKMQWFSLVGEVLDRALSGENSMSLNSLFSAPGGRGQLSMQDFRDADTFVQAVGKLLSYMPDFIEKSYCIWLGVPDYEREITKNIMAMPAEDGGLTDDQGMEIIEIFIDQNYDALDGFFRERLGRLRDRVQARRKDSAPSQRSRR
jgi:hypothetical protein